MGSLAKNKTLNTYPQNIYSDLDSWIRQAAICFKQLGQGKIETTGQFTLSTGTAATVINLSSGILGQNSILLYNPVTSQASTEVANGTIFTGTKDVANKTVTINHASSATTNRTFDYVILG
jgi:hypothetical protein